MPFISSDIFKSMEFVNEIQKKFYDVEDQTTLSIGTFGAEAELFGRTMQNSVRIASETSNEAIPTRAKYEKNVIAHAYMSGLSDLDAVPAYMPAQIIIMKEQVEEAMVNDKFVWDKDIPIMIEDMEFHTDYDITITRNKIGTNKFVFTALYDMSVKNPISDITKPYLPPVGVILIEAGQVLVVTCTLRQVKHQTVNRRMLADNDIENKTIVFSFEEDQLAGFDVVATDGDTTTYLTPVYDGNIDEVVGNFCEYQYINTNTIRLKFNRDSYMPKVNTVIDINLKLTKGNEGNISTSSEYLIDVSSNRFNYKGIYASVRPTGDSDDGRDKKSIAEIRKSMPKEFVSRGTVASTIDLENFFNAFNTDDSKIYPYKRKHNAIDYTYYCYLVMKKFGNVVPANTINLKVDTSQLYDNGNAYVLPPLTPIIYDGTYGTIATEEQLKDIDDLNTFVYSSPYMITINKNPLAISYYLNIIDATKYVEYDYINQSVQLQMVMSSLNILRSGISDRSRYHVTFQMTQNINTDFGIVVENEDGTLTENGLKTFIVFYSEDDANTPYRYVPCKLISYDKNDFLYSYDVALETDDTILVDNKIKINNLLQPGSGITVDSYLEDGCSATIYILAKLDRKYGEDPITGYIPGLEGYSLCNKYKINGGIDLLYNYTQIMNSTPDLKSSVNGVHSFNIANVPVIRRSYMSNESKVSAVIQELETRRSYIEYCLNLIEGGFDIDFKFINTYGPSIRYTLKGDTPLNRVNLSIEFEAKLYSPSDKYIIDLIEQDIKDSIEDINELNELHFANLAHEIKDKYSEQLYYFEFLGFNGYGPGEQYIKGVGTDLQNQIPEFLNVNTLESGEPDIYINVI